MSDSNGIVNNPKSQRSNRPRVLVPEKLSPDGLTLLRKTLEVDERKGLSPEELAAAIPDYDALIVRSETKVTASLLAVGKKLKVVARAGVGVDNVDVDAATKHGIIVVNSPAGNIGAAAEHTIALLLAVARNIPDGCSSLKAGKWERSRLVGVEVKARTLGIIGLGKVGLTVARLASGLGMHVQALDPYASPSLAAAASVTLVHSLPALLSVADFLTIHTPLIASTKGMISGPELASMKKGARILNVARGGMIDESALYDALESGHIAGAGIDVFTTEPPSPDSPAAKLISHPKVVATPHLGASTVEAQENVSIDVCEQVLSILRGELPRSAVNAPLILPEEYKKLQPFVKLVEKMGSLYTQHYSRSHRAPHHQPNPASANAPQPETRTTFDLIYEGEIASLTNTKPLYAALIKGLTTPISAPATPVNIVNAALIARERGLVINEQLSRDPSDTHTYSSLVTLRARPRRDSSRPPSSSRPASSTRASAAAAGADRTQSQPQSQAQHGADGKAAAAAGEQEQTISGFCTPTSIHISRLDRFATSFVPEGTLLICHNYDSPGKIGRVGSVLGKGGVNINFMSVAPVSREREDGGAGGEGQGRVEVDGVGVGDGRAEGEGEGSEGERERQREREALMILGVDREVGDGVVKELLAERGILEVSVVTL